MKIIKIMLTAIAVFTVVGGALAYKLKFPGYHLYQCNLGFGMCMIVDPSNYYQIDYITGSPYPSATVTDIDPGLVPCSNGKCTGTIWASNEFGR